MSTYEFIDHSYDVIVVGAGGSGLRATLGLAEAGLSTAWLLAVFAYHLCAGLRHLVWDTGRGLERAHSRASAYLVLICSIVLFAALAAWLLAGRHA